ncbi:hypothetical protein L1987_64240 [Smallanthus sonchifolius]|uniref:Uncharacterized protein n=1 Tax=Smallanthus sonchifolius TaxID=185202 RepID=A0ACB9CFS9_9ASTR|nr:hypothetical protein L1987_64240 [Smallanthus sonchifolius]
MAKPDARRDGLLRGVKVKGDEAVVKGLIDSAQDSGEKVVEAVVCLGDNTLRLSTFETPDTKIRIILGTRVPSQLQRHIIRRLSSTFSYRGAIRFIKYAYACQSIMFDKVLVHMINCSFV